MAATTTGILNGTDLLIYVGGTKIYHATSHAMSISMNTRDATTKDSAGWRDLLEAALEWSMNGDGLVAFVATYGFDDLFDVIIARTAVVVKLSTEETGDTYYQGSAYLTALDNDNPAEDNSSMTFAFEGTGVLTKYTGT